LEYWFLEVVRPSFLTFKPTSTYTLIRSWCRSMLKMLIIMFLELLFLKSCVMLGGLGRTLSFLQSCFMVFIILFISSMGDIWRGYQHWIIFKHEEGWPLKRSFIYFGPLLNFFGNHHVGRQLCLSIPIKWYAHRGAYEWDYSLLWPPFDLISPSRA
jgi:hypothetical protein